MKSVVLTIALLGCGQVTQGLADAPPNADAAIDAASPAVTVTSLTLTGDGLPDTNVTVIFADKAGNLISDGPVDANGKTQGELPDGGTVTLLRITTDNATTLQGTMVSITGVKPGDDLTFGLHALPNITNGGGQTTMTANYTPVAGAGEHTISTKCGNTTDVAASGHMTLTFRDSCHDATFDMLLIASGGSLNQPAFTKLLGVNFVSGGAFTVPAGATTMQNTTINMTNVDTNVSSMSLSRFSMFDNAGIGEESVGVASPVAGSDTATIPFPQSVGSRTDLHLQFSRSDAVNINNRDIITGTLTNTQDIDVSELEQPWLSNIALTTSGMTWTTVVPGKSPDGMMLTWSGHWTTAAGVATTIAWRVIQPVNATGAALVPVPTKYARFDPAQQTVTISPTIASVIMADYDVVTGYDQFRTQAETLTSGTDLSQVGAFVGMPVQRGTTGVTARLGLN